MPEGVGSEDDALYANSSKSGNAAYSPGYPFHTDCCVSSFIPAQLLCSLFSLISGLWLLLCFAGAALLPGVHGVHGNRLLWFSFAHNFV